jgi:hypothetical protein
MAAYEIRPREDMPNDKELLLYAAYYKVNVGVGSEEKA